MTVPSKRGAFAVVLSVLLALLFLLPILTTAVQSFMNPAQLAAGGFPVIPVPFTLAGYWQIVSKQYAYLFMFWDSMKLAVLSTTLNRKRQIKPRLYSRGFI